MQLSTAIKPIDEIVVPTQLGWTVVTSDGEEENSDCRSLWRAPVIAWLVQLYRRSTDETTFVDVIPITVNGNLSETQEFALQYRGRGAFFTISEAFTDEAALLAHFNKHRAMMRLFSKHKIASPAAQHHSI